MFNAWKVFETGFKNLSSSAANSKEITLAQKYGVPFNNGKFDAGCPGIMSPLGETPEVELQWGAPFSGHNPDKVQRFQQFSQALNLIDAYITAPNAHDLTDGFIGLKIHGRTMFSHIVSKLSPGYKDHKGQIFNIVGPHLTTELDMTEVPYNKGGKTIQQIFDQYIKPVADIYYFPAATATANAEAHTSDTTTLNVNDDEEGFDPGLQAAINLSAANSSNLPASAAGTHDNTMGSAPFLDLTEQL